MCTLQLLALSSFFFYYLNVAYCVLCIIFSRSQKAITSLLEELDVQIYNQWNNGSKIMHSSDDVITTYSSPLPPLSYLALLDFWWFTYKVHSSDYSLKTSIAAVVCHDLHGVLKW